MSDARYCWLALDGQPRAVHAGDWLEDLVERDDYLGLDLFGHVAAGLHRVAEQRRLPWIIDGLRPFPASGPEAEAAWSSMTRIDPTEFADSIADRLYELER